MSINSATMNTRIGSLFVGETVTVDGESWLVKEVRTASDRRRVSVVLELDGVTFVTGGWGTDKVSALGLKSESR